MPSIIKVGLILAVASGVLQDGLLCVFLTIWKDRADAQGRLDTSENREQL